MKKAILLAVAMIGLWVMGAIVVFAGPQYTYRNNNVNTNNAVVFTNHFVDALSFSSAMFSFQSSGTYTARVEIVEQSGFTNRVLDEIISSGMFGLWLPENKTWVESSTYTGMVRVTCFGATSTTVARVRLQFDK